MKNQTRRRVEADAVLAKFSKNAPPPQSISFGSQ